MKIIVIGGFLGSGKTTTVIQLGTYYSSLQKSVGIIVNEVGEIGIDGDVISRFGLETKEITAGCICCSLKMTLRATLLTMIENFNPDIVIIESTGVAYPGLIRDEIDLMNLKSGYIMAPLLTLFDGSRFKQIMKEIKNFASGQLKDAEVIAVSKCDLVDPVMLPVIESGIQQMNPNARIIRISSKNPDSMANLIDILDEARQQPDAVQKEKALLGQNGNLFMAGGSIGNNNFGGIGNNNFGGIGNSAGNTGRKSAQSIADSGVGSFSAEFVFKNQRYVQNMSDSDCENIAKDIMSQIQKNVLSKSPNFLGHIKLFLENNGKTFKTNLTTSEEDPQFEIIDSDSKDPVSKLKILSAATGIESEELKKIVTDAIEKFMKKSGIEI
ncbi:GTP-binding protein [Methanolapillus ohkumae]|uniref:CobW/HypB/UreG nucleotide-binding domain-containing protein n=1 Tax=Methanolapillus ohkumae TaxID=3028298 RepID=A0AA96VFY4_9EURY|nr:hypothetical protein MsAm2_15780 [Methanosarcinaceae archaeon Am2]